MELGAEVTERIFLTDDGLMWELPVDVIQSMETVVVCNLQRIFMINQTLTLQSQDKLLKANPQNAKLCIKTLLQQIVTFQQQVLGMKICP